MSTPANLDEILDRFWLSSMRGAATNEAKAAIIAHFTALVPENPLSSNTDFVDGWEACAEATIKAIKEQK